MRVNEVMTRNCDAVRVGETLQNAARRMREENIGALFVNDDNAQVTGIITDRDIAIRAVADAAAATDTVGDYMSRDVIACYEDDDIETAIQIMEEQQIRRLMVCNDNDEPVGMLAQADIARALGRAPLTGEMLQSISEPGGEDRAAH